MKGYTKVKVDKRLAPILEAIKLEVRDFLESPKVKIIERPKFLGIIRNNDFTHEDGVSEIVRKYTILFGATEVYTSWDFDKLVKVYYATRDTDEVYMDTEMRAEYELLMKRYLKNLDFVSLLHKATNGCWCTLSGMRCGSVFNSNNHYIVVRENDKDGDLFSGIICGGGGYLRGSCTKFEFQAFKA